MHSKIGIESFQFHFFSKLDVTVKVRTPFISIDLTFKLFFEKWITKNRQQYNRTAQIKAI